MEEKMNKYLNVLFLLILFSFCNGCVANPKPPEQPVVKFLGVLENVNNAPAFEFSISNANKFTIGFFSKNTDTHFYSFYRYWNSQWNWIGGGDCATHQPIIELGAGEMVAVTTTAYRVSAPWRFCFTYWEVKFNNIEFLPCIIEFDFPVLWDEKYDDPKYRGYPIPLWNNDLK